MLGANMSINMSKYEYLQNIKKPLNQNFHIVGNQEKWVKIRHSKFGKQPVIALSFCIYLLTFFRRVPCFFEK